MLSSKDLATRLSYLYSDATYRLYHVHKHNEHYVKEAEKKYGKIIITGNHCNRLDGNFIIKAYKSWKDVREGKLIGSWVKEELLDYPIVGKIFEKTQTAIPISRKKGSLTDEVIEHTKKILDEYKGVLIFMQGSTRRAELRTPKTGPVRAAIACGAVIVPVGIYPNEKVRMREALLRKKPIHLTFGQAILIPPPTASSYEGKKKYYREQTNKVWEVIQELIEESSLSATNDR